MAGTRRSARTTKHVDQNAGQRITRSTAARQRAEVNKPTTSDASVTAVPGRKRKALGDNTNAERKPVKTDGSKGKDKDKGKKAPVLKAKGTTNSIVGTSTTRPTPMKLVVEIPMRKRRRVQPESEAVATNQFASSSTKASSVLLKPPRNITTRGNRSGTIKKDVPISINDTQVEPPTLDETAHPAVVQTLFIDNHTFEDEPPAKQLRSGRSPGIPPAQLAPAQLGVASPAQDEDNPFEIALQPNIGENQPWDDLDAEDESDPAMVSEYVNEIFNYMKELESETMPSSIYMNAQPDLEWHLRGILMDWLIQVHERFRLLPETLFIAANLVDRFLSVRVVSLAKLQLVGITGLFVAAKYEEIMVPTLQDFLRVADSDYSGQEILAAEKYLLRTLGWNISYPNPMGFLRRANKAEDYDANTRTLAKFLIEISVVEERLLKYTPSMLAAAGLWLARLILDKPEWNANLEHYSGYTESKLVHCANIMVNFLLQPIKHDSLWRKYSKKKYMKCAVVARKWAEVRWPPEENHSGREEIEESIGLVDVDLAAALPYLREQALARANDSTEA
ncbi:G2/mitotic-specific cyclin cdc13 [Rhizoctonia solani AG-3 Rhs1AP]|uniref:G2/mitotic-specific cyclin cdc13 n=1 Tax=Rhizoctonia solani AG-3 Rhs1AP TaxID=1086054 RepID=X8J654_9AGAM|nr:G2/mitotic-specific cyclin cdc13 [Rhizoctonia solani AG-3 Rhs1AP]